MRESCQHGLQETGVVGNLAHGGEESLKSAELGGGQELRALDLSFLTKQCLPLLH